MQERISNLILAGFHLLYLLSFKIVTNKGYNDQFESANASPNHFGLSIY